MKFKTSKVKAHQILEDDRFKMGGKMLQVLESRPHQFGSERRHITAYLLNGSPQYDRVALFVPANMKFKIYNQK